MVSLIKSTPAPSLTTNERRVVFGMTFPAIDGGVITEGHRKYCAEFKHATYTIDGVDTPNCPRCGEPNS